MHMYDEHRPLVGIQLSVQEKCSTDSGLLLHVRGESQLNLSSNLCSIGSLKSTLNLVNK